MSVPVRGVVTSRIQAKPSSAVTEKARTARAAGIQALEAKQFETAAKLLGDAANLLRPFPGPDLFNVECDIARVTLAASSDEELKAPEMLLSAFVRAAVADPANATARDAASAVRHIIQRRQVTFGLGTPMSEGG